MRQHRDPFLVKKWRVSWTDKPTGVRVTDVYSAKHQVGAMARAEREHPEGTAFRVGPYHGGVDVPKYHAALT